MNLRFWLSFSIYYPMIIKKKCKGTLPIPNAQSQITAQRFILITNALPISQACYF